MNRRSLFQSLIAAPLLGLLRKERVSYTAGGVVPTPPHLTLPTHGERVVPLHEYQRANHRDGSWYFVSGSKDGPQWTYTVTEAPD